MKQILMKTSLTCLLTMGAFLCAPFACAQNPSGTADVPHASMYLHAWNRQAVKVPFAAADPGTPTLIHWGMDTAWDDEGNVLRGINFIGRDRLTYGRVSFQVMDALNEDGTLSTRQLNYLKNRLRHISLTHPDGILLNSDPVDINTEVYTHHPEAWYKVIKATLKYVQDYGLKVVSIAPFNEPDVTASNQGTKADFKAVAKLLKEDPFFEGIRICAGNTCNNDGATEWYDYMKPYVDEGNTHQLAGDFNHYADFYTHVKADGNMATNDELHNVMEGIVGANYGMENGIWWGTVGPSRGDFCLATSEGGARLGYGENRAAWSGAAVYRLPDGRIKAFAGASERQASPSSYEYVCRDKPVYFDGYGPAYSFAISLPGGYRYGDAFQKSAERSVQVCEGADVPLCPLTNGNYIIVNKKSQKLLTIQSGSTNNSAAVVLYDNRRYAYQQWTLEHLSDNAGDLTGYYVHSVRNAEMNMETGGFQVKVGGTVSVYPVTKAENQRWTFEYAGDGYYRIRNYQSGLYLEATGGSTANNAAVTLCAGATEDHQLWKFLPVDAPCETNAPQTPVNLVATPRSHSVLLSWDANVQDKDFNGYVVLRGEKDERGEIAYDVIGRGIQTNRFLDNTARPRHTYYYAVQSVDYSQNRSVRSVPVSASLADEKGLVARYEFESSACDMTENQLHGVVCDPSSLATQTTEYRSGKNALLLDGVSTYMCLPVSACSLSDATYAVWVCAASGSFATNSCLYNFVSDADHYATLSLNTGGNIVYRIKNGETEQTLQASSLTEGWHHVALTIGTERVTIYVDGVEVASAPVSVRLSDLCPVVNGVGANLLEDVPLMDGFIDDLRIYNYALSANEINDIIGQTIVQPRQADGWNPPILPSKDVTKVTSTESILLYNVDADAFVTYGMDWNTQSLAQRLPKGDTTFSNKYRIKVQRQAGNKLYVSMNDKPNVYIGCLADGCNVWSDRSKSEGGFVYQPLNSPSGIMYILKSESQKANLDLAYAYGGPLTTSNGRGYTHWAFIPSRDITNGNYAKYKERKQLFKLQQAILEARKEADYASELQQAYSVYSDENTSVAELRKATRQLLLATANDLTVPVDATSLFTNADMLGNATTADWTDIQPTISDGDIQVLHQTFKLQQTQTDLPNGIYEAVFHAFYRNDGAGPLPVISATAENTVKGNLTTLQDIQKNEVLLNTGENIAGAAQTLTSDKAQTILSDIIVTDHQMTLSANVTSSNQWLNFQGFSLTYKSPLVTVQVPASGYTTFYYSNQNFLLPEGVQAFTLKEQNGSIVVSRELTEAGTVLSAGQGVLLKAVPGTYVMVPTTKKRTADPFNQLRGSDEDQLTRGGYYYYVLSEDLQETGWKWDAADGATFVNPAHHAYFVSKSQTTPQEFYPLNPIMSVSEVTIETSCEDEPMYNLAGQRVDKSYRSIVVKKGRKLLVK